MGIRSRIYGEIGRRLAREPLFHFLVAGALLLAVSAMVGGTREQGSNRVVVSTAKLQQLRDTWTRQWGRPPTDAQLRTLIDDHVREDILYREAVASGLDRDDTIIRRHLAQKVEFLAQGAAAAVDPTDAELSSYFQEHRSTYAVQAKVAFSHVYFSLARRGEAATTDANAALERLRSGTAGDPKSFGDAFMLQYEFPPQSRDEVRDLFGPGFANRLFELPPGAWTGPVESSYGVHLVRVAETIPPRVPPLEDVRDAVRLDFLDRRTRAASDAYYQQLRSRYDVSVAAFAEASAPKASAKDDTP